MKEPQSMYEHQDWEVVRVHKQRQGNGTDKQSINAALRTGQPVETHAKVSGQVREYSSRARKLEADVNVPSSEEAPAVAPLSKLSGGACRDLIKARTDKHLTQAQLAQRCNAHPSIIKTLEAGGIVQDRSILGKVNKVLGTHIKFDQ